MSTTFASGWETFLTLRRDKVFYPALVFIVLIFFLASFIAEWSVDDFRVIFFNFSQTMFRLAGDVLALVFGSKLLLDARTDGSIETSLARPIGRGGWVIGKFVGLALCLVTFGIMAGLSWVAIDFYYEIGTPLEMILWGVLLSVAEWLVVGAMTVFFSTIGNFGTTIFASSCLWILGLFAGAINASFTQTTTNDVFIQFIRSIATFWNFDRFSIIHYSYNFELPGQAFLIGCIGYGAALILVLISMATITVKSRDMLS